MQERAEIRHFHHALKVLEDVCIGCTHCMTVCPTEAVRVKNGLAVISPDRCIDCGECYKACPVNAIIVEQDDFETIFEYKARVVLVPSVLIGQFPEKIPAGSIYAALTELGFTHVYEVESTIGYILHTYNKATEADKGKPMISSFCPAVIRLIQVRFPSLIRHIKGVKPPIDISAQYYRRKLINAGYNDNEIGIFYITPCAAKIAAVKSPVGEEKSPVDGVINMKFMYNRILQILRKIPEIGPNIMETGMLSSEGILWCLTRGESKAVSGRALAIDGIHNVSEFLEKLENEEAEDIDFLELRACDESCAGGILISGNRFLTVERLAKRAEGYKDAVLSPDWNMLGPDDLRLGEIKPRPVEHLDTDISKALAKMERKRRLMCYLPAFDCGACGAPNCQSLAEDIVQGGAQVSSCIFMQQMMLKTKTLSLEHALKITGKIWGENRLDKDCSKTGAEDENS